MKNYISGKFKKGYDFQSFSPSMLNNPLEIDAEVQTLLSEADRLLGTLNSYSKLVPDVDFFIHMHVTKEATTSSRIEGTRTEFDEALLKEREIKPEKRNDWQEVQNYTKAMNSSIKLLQELPLSMRLIKETHRILLSGTRGSHSAPGEIRKSQNWIGGKGPSDAVYVPPTHEELPDLLTDLEKFWHNKSLKIPHLIKTALIHYQFETIHPFLDGNGRIGRLLITLYLIDKKLLSKPTLYLSDYFERNRIAYYDALTTPRVKNDIKHWLKFFLNGVIEMSIKSCNTFDSILELKKICEEKILKLDRRAETGNKLLRELFSKPITDAREIGERLNLSHPAVNPLIAKFEELKILKEVTGYKRNRLFAFVDYINIFK